MTNPIHKLREKFDKYLWRKAHEAFDKYVEANVAGKHEESVRWYLRYLRLKRLSGLDR